MTFDWREYHRLARFFSGNTEVGYNEEAAQRSAVSRAYYAAFCHARNRARDHLRFAPAGDGSDHSRLRNHLRRAGLSDIAKLLNDLRRWRNQCDYADAVASPQVMAHQAIRKATHVLDELA